MAIHLTPEANPTVQEGTLYVDSATGEFNVAGRTVPHIIPGVLYPAVAGKLLDGTTSHSGNYGTPQTQTGGDGRSYYYTDIKGSKPIKDPRIGGHFGSQRCTMRSWQLLEQETAMEGYDVYSVDGREWMRINDMGQGVAYGNNPDGGDGVMWEFNGSGAYLEVTGYFSAVNMLWFPHTSGDDFNWKLDGASAGSVSSGVSVSSPLGNRYVNCGSVYNLPFSSPLTTPGIHTIKLVATSGDFVLQGFELIAQDTTSTANRSKIQIPSQDVVSYGKKFNISGTPHYNPFNGYTATSSFSSVVDVDTSLGLEAWKHTDNNYYPPINGGRVVKWVDSSGAIKTSVTLMPPNATGIGSFSSNPRDPNYGSWSSQYQPTFKNETERQLHEVAKAFHFREFGNGAANGGTGATWADASMLSGDNDPDTGGDQSDNIAYVMDDGLTSLSGQSLRIQNLSTYGGLRIDSNNQSIYFTFIGTGIRTIRQRDNSTTEEPVTWAQNLPYGTHILELQRDGSANQVAKIDGVTLETNSTTDKYLIHGSPTFFQPKRPPIPEEAVIISDYMLMSDFVIKGTNTGGNGVDAPITSKGVRRLDCSRDVFYTGASYTLSQNVHGGSGFFFVETGDVVTAGDVKATIPAFGTNFSATGYNMNGRTRLDLNGSTATFTNSNTGNGHGTFHYLTNNTTLGVNDFRVENLANNRVNFAHLEIATPTHTSSHYQSFESPFLHELIGGDRNMEQINLVCSPDGKTWDQITRDTSYIGNGVLNLNGVDAHNNSTSAKLIFTDTRGVIQTENDLYNKDFAIAYDRQICLKDGQYKIHVFTISWDGPGAGDHGQIVINDNVVARSHMGSSGYTSGHVTWQGNLKRGDYVQVMGQWHASSNYSGFSITRI